MNYSDLVTDFAKRTLANLDIVKRAVEAGNPEAYEVTQLWNSLLGLIVAPRELDVQRLPSLTLAQLHALGWPDITTGGKLQKATLEGLVRSLRNAVAHFNVEFQANGNGEIHEVWLWNEEMKGGRPVPNAPHVWDARLDIFQLEELGRKIAATYVKGS
jgi:HEPN pEK499 p136